MKITEIVMKEYRDYVQLSGCLKWENASDEKLSLWFHLPKDIIHDKCNGDAFLVAALLPCLLRKEDIYVDSEVSQQLINNLPYIMDIFCLWDRRLNKITIRAKNYNQ